MSKHINLLVNDIYEKVEELIGRNQMKPHEKLPSERYLAELWDVNRLTLREALEKLANEGKVYSLHGKGTFVAPAKFVDHVNCFISFSKGWKSEGHSVSSRKVSLRRVEANKKICRNLEIAPGTAVFELKRVRILDRSPLSIETVYLPVSLCPDLDKHDFEIESLYEAMESYYGIQPAKQRQIASLSMLTKRESELLDAEEGDPAFCISGIMSDSGGRPIEYSIAVVRADRYAIKTFLHSDTCDPIL